MIKARCLAPGFSTASDNTMTSAHADVQVLEWDSKYVTYDPTDTTRYNVKQYVGTNLGRSNLDKYNLWPKIATDWVNKDDQTNFVPGQLGNILMDLTPTEKVAANKKYQEVPGNWINIQMKRSRDEFTKYHSAKAIFDSLKNQYNGAMRLSSGKAEAYAAPTGASALDVVLPKNSKIGGGTFTYPAYPFQVYVPPAYTGPTLSNIGYDQIVFGFGKPMASMYILELGNADVGKTQKNYKNFGTMGILLLNTAYKTLKDAEGTAVAESQTLFTAISAATLAKGLKDLELKTLE